MGVQLLDKTRKINKLLHNNRVPLSDRVTETVRGRRDYKVRNYFNKCCTGKTTGRRSSSSRTGWSC